MEAKKTKPHPQILSPSVRFLGKYHRLKLMKIIPAIILTASFASLVFAETESLQPLFDRLDKFIEQKMMEGNIPGIAVALTDRNKLLRVSTYGYSDIGTKIPVTPETLFDLGSIGKSFTSIALLQLYEKGRLDLHAPVTRYLPWFQLRSQYDPITCHHLLSHTAGITNGSDLAPHGSFEVWGLRQQKTAVPPGKRYHYSNVGYKTLGLLLEEVLDQPLGKILNSGILDPLNMNASHGSITHKTRKIMAVGYRPFYDDRPDHSSYPQIPATWHEYGAGDGCIASTAADAAAYLRMYLNRGRGPKGRILSEETFNLMTHPKTEVSKEQSYGYGIRIEKIDGYAHLTHGGGTPGFRTVMLADMDNGYGAVVLTNSLRGGIATGSVSRFALKLLRATKLGKELPEVPPSRDPLKVEDAADYSGTYKAGDKSFTMIEEGNRLILQQGDDRIALEPRGNDRFYVNHPDYSLFLLEFSREEGIVVEAFHGSSWYVNDRYKGPATFDTPKEWIAYTGHYRSHNPWGSNFRVFLRKGVLTVVRAGGSATTLSPIGKGVFRLGKEKDFPEFIKFDAIASGRALRATLKSCEYYRAFTQ